MSAGRTVTFVMIKPDGVERGLIGAVIQRFEQKEFKLVQISDVRPTVDMVEEHYAEHKGKPFFDDLVASLAGKKVVCMLWSAEEDTVKQVRALIGSASVADRLPGTIRHDFASTVRRNVIHASDSTQAVVREMNIWFK